MRQGQESGMLLFHIQVPNEWPSGRTAEYTRRELIPGFNPYHLETPRPDQYPRMWEDVRFVWISEIVEGV